MDVPNGPDTFPQRLHALRTAMGKSQAQLAKLCEGNPSQRTIRRWEQGDVDPQLGSGFTRLAEVLNVPPPYLRWGGEE